MPRSYRSILVALAGLAVVATSLGTWAYFGALKASYDSHQHEESANNTARSKKANPHQIDRDRAGLPYFAESIASAPDPDTSDEREKRDLAAQEAAALWGFWILVVSGVSSLITMIGTGFLLWQIMLTREAVKDTGDATKAMMDANKIAVQHVSPYFGVVSQPRGQILFYNDTYNMSLQVTLINAGQTPAFGFAFNFEINLYEGGVFIETLQHDGTKRLPTRDIPSSGEVCPSIDRLIVREFVDFTKISMKIILTLSFENTFNDWHDLAIKFTAKLLDDSIAARRPHFEIMLDREYKGDSRQ